MPHYEKLLIQIVNMAHICENDMIQLKDMFQLVVMWLQFSTEERVSSWNYLNTSSRCKVINCNIDINGNGLIFGTFSREHERSKSPLWYDFFSAHDKAQTKGKHVLLARKNVLDKIAVL